MKKLSFTAISAADAATTQTTTWFDTAFVTDVSLQSTVAGGTSIVGTLKLQGSDDIAAADNMPFAPPGPAHWNDVPNTFLSEVAATLTYTVAVSGNNSVLYPVTKVGYRWLRVVYTYTSGTGGTITVNFHGTQRA